MTPDQPESRPEGPPSPSVYGGEWGGSGKQNPEDVGKPDRPDKIKTPDAPVGAAEDPGPTDTHGDT